MLYRNHLVFKERTKAHSKIFEKQNGDYIWSAEISSLILEVDSIATYNQIFYRFWRRPSSFYKDFLEKLENKKLYVSKIKNTY